MHGAAVLADEDDGGDALDELIERRRRPRASLGLPAGACGSALPDALDEPALAVLADARISPVQRSVRSVWVAVVAIATVALVSLRSAAAGA